MDKDVKIDDLRNQIKVLCEMLETQAERIQILKATIKAMEKRGEHDLDFSITNMDDPHGDHDCGTLMGDGCYVCSQRYNLGLMK